MAVEGISNDDINDIVKELGKLSDPKYLDQYKIDKEKQNRDFSYRLEALGTTIAVAMAGTLSWYYKQKAVAGGCAALSALAFTQTLPSSKEAELRKKIQTDLGAVGDQLHKASLVVAQSIADKINTEKLSTVGQANQKAKNILLGYAHANVSLKPEDQQVSRLFRTICHVAGAVSKLPPLEGSYHPELIATVDKIKAASKQFLNGGAPAGSPYVKNELKDGVVHSQPWPKV